MGKSIGIYAYITEWKKGERVEKTLEAHTSGRQDWTFRELLEFQKDAKKAFNAVHKAALAGNYVRYDLVVNEYDSDGKLVNSEAWQAKDDTYFYEDDDRRKAIYLEPDTRYTRDSWDMVMYSDVITSLAEAGI